LLFRYAPFLILAIVMLAFVLPIGWVVGIAALTIVLFAVAWLINSRHPLLFPPQKVWERYREEHAAEGILMEEKAPVVLQTGVHFVSRRRYRATKRRLPGYLLLTNKWFLVFCGDVPVIFIAHAAEDPAMELWVSVRERVLILDAHRYGGTTFGHSVVKVFTANARQWLDILAPEES
jgi:hypothetical protein